MNHDLLKNIIYDQHELIQNADIVARPSYSFEPNANYVLVGLRRAGKSTLLFKIVQDLVAKGITWEQIIYINFEDERLSEFQKEDFNDILSVQSELSAERGYFSAGNAAISRPVLQRSGQFDSGCKSPPRLSFESAPV